MSPTLTPLLDSTEIELEILAGLRARDARLEPLARRQLARLTPERWTIEWQLPTWLGAWLDLPGGFVHGLTRSNVLGLLAVRLEDDLADGEVDLADVAHVRALHRLAYDEAIAGYRDWFHDASPIWAFIERSMAAWRAGSGSGGANLATRGAPIRIAAYASCLRGDRLDAWLPLARCLDDAVTALVLYDQLVDWEADLAAGRWNAFVARALGGEQPDRHRGADRTDRGAVLAAMLTSPVVREYVDAAVGAAISAATTAADLGIPELARFLAAWARRTTDQGAEIASRYQDFGERAASLLFGTRLEGAAT